MATYFTDLPFLELRTVQDVNTLVHPAGSNAVAVASDIPAGQEVMHCVVLCVANLPCATP